MAWYDNAVIYHIYPLGLCGCSHENRGQNEYHFDKLNQWSIHAKDMGCTCIYIGPLFESQSHGYDTTDYRKVDRRLGSNQDFKDFIQRCHNMNIKVIVDGVFNHTGRNFFAFQDLKKNRENSVYKDWYCNVNFWGNNEYNDGFFYDSWGGCNSLPRLNNANYKVRQYHFETVRYWIREFDSDGIRLDAADVLDFNFMRELRGLTNNIKNEFWLLGEVIHGDYRQWVNDSTLHSVTNYAMHHAIYSSHNSHNYFEVAHGVKRMVDMYGDSKLYNFLDNHDVSRIYNKLYNKQHLYNVSLLLYTIPGIPSIYYGSEFCVSGDKQSGSDWNLRPCLELNDYSSFYEKSEITKLLCKLGDAKKKYPELTYGYYQELYLTNRQYAYSRIINNRAVVVILNNDDYDSHMEITIPFEVDKAENILNNNTGRFNIFKKQGYSQLNIDIPTNYGYILYVY